MFTVSASPDRQRGRTRRAGIVAGALALGAVLATTPACTSAQLDGVSPSYLIIDALEAASGAEPTQFGGFLESDVVGSVEVEIDGDTVRVPTIYEDRARVALRVAMRDPGSVESPTSPSTANRITVNRYHVEFVRTDGRNVPGVDVPYPFDGAMTVTVDATGQSASLVLVRLQAKAEAPLQAMAGGGGALAISTIARVTFYGRDQAGRDVSAEGTISVNFADWADPE